MIIKPIATNVITGFLGVGKTTLIKRLLADKPVNEKWAVLVNEFGEVGIDAALLGRRGEGVEIREVAGGCMCCAAGVPMQVAINQLIAKAKPDRLLIEPTGLGHPREVLRLLSEPHYQNVIKLKSTLCLVDARKVTDARYREHDIFNQQLEVADIILATKSDLYTRDSLSELNDYLQQKSLSNKACNLLTVSMAEADSAALPHELMTLLNEPAVIPATRPSKPASWLIPKTSVFELDYDYDYDVLEFDERGMVSKSNTGEGAYSCGWVFDPSYEFNFDGLLIWVKSLDVLRFKAVVITDEGIAGINLVDGEMTITELDDVMDSRLELICLGKIETVEIEAKLISLARRLIF
ncbi:GTP-binding protein [Shewanella sp.]|uniref:CobW family GTP-binding protein n=1 Tax=Shewanella sp. TaxID=50422 RepID=UPI001EB31260|nr:GTP-binding protein [Shewanella sp.]NRB25071.1 GTP-binding protein [Shewanella sp.]